MGKAKTAYNAKLQYEAGQSNVALQAMTDSGDHTTFSITDYPWSQKSGCEPSIRPNGLVTGGAITAGSSNDEVSVASLTCYLAGILTTVNADSSVSVTRPAASPTGQKCINSITIDSTGAIVVVVGTDGSSFSATRNAAGGPPYIPVGSIEIGQVKLDDDTAALVTTDEISQVAGSSLEKYNYPVWSENPFAGTITFSSALSAIHTGATYNKVYIEIYEPVFAELDPVENFVPPENSYSVSSKQVYGNKNIAATSSSLGQGSFTFFGEDAVTDNIIALAGEILFFKFYPDRTKTAYHLCYGKLGISRKFPAGDSIQVDCTISPSEIGKDYSS